MGYHKRAGKERCSLCCQIARQIQRTNESATMEAPHDNNNDEQNGGAHSQAYDSYVQGLLNQIVHCQIEAQNGLATTGQPQFNTNGGMEEEIIVGGAGSHFGDRLPSKKLINILHIILQVYLHDIYYCHFIMFAYA